MWQITAARLSGGVRIFLVAGSLSVLTGGAAAQDNPGELIFNNTCRTCHTVKEGDNRLGPSLFGVVGRRAGSLAGFPYSDGMKKSGLTWDEAALDRFIENPDAVVRGNGMKPFAGVAKAEDRTAIIAYLKTQSGGAQ